MQAAPLQMSSLDLLKTFSRLLTAVVSRLIALFLKTVVLRNPKTFAINSMKQLHWVTP